ncbi:hypothetical protein JCM13580A_19710 [Streptomyces drozdowiczii]
MQDRTGVRRASDVEAAPDDQLGVVAPDVHMRSPGMLRGPVRLSETVSAPTDCGSDRVVAVCKRTDTQFTPRSDAGWLRTRVDPLVPDGLSPNGARPD